MTVLLFDIEHEDGRRELVRKRGSGPFWIGREPYCDLVLSSSLVSRRHLCVTAEANLLRVRDLSSNGTIVEDELLLQSERVLPSPVLLRIGPHRLHVRTRGDAPPNSLPSRDPRNRSMPDSLSASEVPVALRRLMHRRVLEHLDLGSLKRHSLDEESMRPKVTAALIAVCDELRDELPEGVDRDGLVLELCDEVLGLGPLEQLLNDPDVSEIMVVDHATIFAERRGCVEPTGLCFTDDDSVRAVIERIVTPLGRRIDESNPLVDARLRDGSRVNAVIPPLALKGPCITIRKFGRSPLTLEKLIELGSLDARMGRFLTRAVQARKNIVVSGGTGSGKTTLLNVLSGAISTSERIVTIEDAAELRLLQPHVVSLEARPPNLEGRGEITIRDLVRNALRMRPDRIVVGECRGGEAIDMMQAMNTGHEGSMTTTHANSPMEAIARLETLCLMAGIDLPLRAIRSQIASSIHVVVQQTRLHDGFRCISCISEVIGLNDAGEIELGDVFRYERTSADDGPSGGEFRATGYLPRCVHDFLLHGLVTDGEFL